MNTTFPFLQRLGVDETTDERSIRRAYARELKQLDHEHDIEGFQQLREAYDTALDWMRRQVAAPQPPSEPLPLPLPQPQASGPRYGPPPVAVHQRLAPAAAPDPVPALLVVLAGFDAGFERLCANGTPQIDAVTGLLRESLASEALEGLAARERFEEHMAHRLAQGWRPGHETLFPAACTVFGWSDDSRRLQRFGDKGDYLNQAIEQRLAFDTHGTKAMRTVRIRSQDMLLGWLRAPRLPEQADMLHVFDFFETLTFSMSWLCVVAPRENVLRWRAYYDEIGMEPGSSRTAQAAPVELREAPEDKATFWWFPLLLMVPLLLQLLRWGYNELERQARHAISANASFERKLDDDFRERIRQRIAYNAQPGTIPVSFSVHLDGSGNVIALVKGQASNDPAFDAAAEQAIRASQPFPANVTSPVYIFLAPPGPGGEKRPVK